MRKICAFSIAILIANWTTSFGLVQTLDEGLNALSSQIAAGMTEGNKQKIAVVEFYDLDGKTTELGRYVSEELITRLFTTKKFNVVERQLLNKVIEEHKLNLSGLVDVTTAKELGKILGVDAICAGTITDLGNSVKINARLISTETGSIFAVASTEIQKDEVVRKLMGSVSPTNPKPEKTEPQGSQFEGKPLEAMNVLEGKWTRRPNTVIREVKYPNALYFNDERIVVRLLKKYKTLTMKVGVDDAAGLRGWKRFWIKDHEGTVLFEGKAMPNVEPVNVEVDIGRADWIEVNALDYNSQTPEFVRWINVGFIPN